MNSNGTADADREARLSEVLADWLEAAERGTPPDEAEFLRRYPELAGELAECLADWKRFPRPGGAPARPLATLEPSLPESGLLGDFRILREVGRGGMGVVYEAEQVSLGRRVALKVLPFAATMDPRQLQRFHNEARAAAGLHHTNIVPVYAVGCERGVHYYAMQFIDGRTLAELIARQRGEAPPQVPTADEAASTPPPAAQATSAAPRDAAYFRRAAEWGIQAAEALDCAHTLGVVHRDVKPSNLMVDGTGRLWVTDFGLAQVQSDTRLTMTGDLVGTLRYMSPEQALAKRVVIDHRTDVYSLGATLYELLTLRPAFAGSDRQELLRQIAFEEPQPPRRVNKGIPAELETIVLKATEKNPADRYATAQELADDLRRFLEDRPLRARRPSWVQVARKWARRHRPGVRAATVLLLVLLVVGIGSALWWVGQRAAGEAEARAALQEAVRWQQDEKWSEALSAVQHAQGALRSFGADAGLRQQVEQRAKDLEMAQRLEEARLQLTAANADGHFDSEGCIEAYAAAFAWYGLDVEHGDADSAAEFIRSRSIPMQLVAALDFWAKIQRTRGRQGWKHLLAVAGAADADASRSRAREAWEHGDGKTIHDLLTSAAVDAPPATLALLVSPFDNWVPSDQVVSLLRRAQQRHPADFWINHDLAWALDHARPPQREEALRHYMISVALRPQSPAAHYDLGLGLYTKGLLDEAIAEYREAIKLKKGYLAAVNNLWVILRTKARQDEAIDELRAALHDTDAPVIHYDLALALQDKGRLDEAIDEYRKAVERKNDYLDAHINLGNALHQKGRLDEAIAEFQKVIAIDPKVAAGHINLGNALKDKNIEKCRDVLSRNKSPGGHINLGNALLARDRLDEAIVEYRAAIGLNPDDALAHNNLGTALQKKNQLEEAIAEHRQAIRLKPDDANSYNQLGNALRQVKGGLEEAVGAYRKAISLNNDLAAAHYGLGTALEQQGQFAEALASLRRAQELGLRGPAIKRCERSLALDRKLSAILSGKQQPADVTERIALAEFCQLPSRWRYAAAVRFYEQAFAAEPKLADSSRPPNRYHAACCAALAGCGQGEDAEQSDDQERARLRRQALEWLRADLAVYRHDLERVPDQAGPAVRQGMQHWQQNKDFAGVRGTEALARLPEAERTAWQQLWADIADTLAKTQAKAVPEKKPDGK
jgi:tetratricopeptide (TPR) repeat protein